MVKRTLKQIKEDYLDESIPIEEILDCDDGCPLTDASCCEKKNELSYCDGMMEQVLAEKLIKIGLIIQ